MITACCDFEKAMDELKEQDPGNLVLNLLTPVLNAAQLMKATCDGDKCPITAAMYLTGDLVQL